MSEESANAEDTVDVATQQRRARHLENLENKVLRIIARLKTLNQPLNGVTLSKAMGRVLLAEGEEAAFAVQMFATNFIYEKLGAEAADEWNTKATMHFMGRKPFEGKLPKRAEGEASDAL